MARREREGEKYVREHRKKGKMGEEKGKTSCRNEKYSKGYWGNGRIIKKITKIRNY